MTVSPMTTTALWAPRRSTPPAPAPTPAPTPTQDGPSDFVRGADCVAGKAIKIGTTLLGGVAGLYAGALVGVPLVAAAGAIGPVGILLGAATFIGGAVAGGYAGRHLGCAIDRGTERLSAGIATRNQLNPAVTQAVAKTIVASLVTAPLGLTPITLIAIGIGGLVGAGRPEAAPQKP